ncbi:ubiquitin carboxyl-terminal hydrolase 2 [Eremomyces bilateralis CBS 781.70]|uniref:Ubiquitin carboxyl-terminal hydrolase n=1 Tax=Eremomyces bilateralis CBS 781.70 TaxID=1392243 RepID=A0A6G1G194_9PEZI|nr:ubiquitin carboxyl-terminal hydrolase 2 [Eremomyces bilateralis CBS 781.70]KAF1811824.1 ubiquitin carboxyl-terminal hydrolase 2 [Eremomyces bilateralis CBS 781.70]
MSFGWNTIESDAGVFTFLLQELGAKDVQFEELFALDANAIRELSPVHGVIFLFKYIGPSSDQEAGSGAATSGKLDSEAAERIFFARQVIQNACGTQALLSVLLNKDDEIEIGDKMREFKDFTSAFPVDLRGEALSNSELIRTAHNTFARSSPFIDETQRPADASDDVYHFIAYSSIAGRLYELDGLEPAPRDHGLCTTNEFPDKVIPILQERISRYPEGEVRFNLMAMCRDLRVRAREIGDQESLEREEKKRRDWVWENALRKHNFVGFVGELTNGVVRSKVETGDYQAWVDAAKEKTRKRVEERRQQGVEDEGDV